jgi:hypothetical protein
MVRLCYWHEALDFLRSFVTQILQVPGLLTIIIAATRMYRSLADYASRLPDETYEILHLLFLSRSQCFRAHTDVQRSDIAFSNAKPERTHAISIPFNRRELSVNANIESHLTSQTNSDSCGVNTNDKQPNDLHLDDNVECGA